VARLPRTWNSDPYGNSGREVILLTGATEQAYDPGARARLRALSADLAGV
jgi:hypothetical protein